MTRKRKKKGPAKQWSGKPCPFCGNKRTVNLSEHMFRCHNCDKHFDDDPDEGGDWGADPARRMMREEERTR